jgi:hypothetical protein
MNRKQFDCVEMERKAQKKFDCVDMQHAGGRRIYSRLKGRTAAGSRQQYGLADHAPFEQVGEDTASIG